VYKGYSHDATSRPAALVVDEAPLLVLAGEAFTKSGFEGCANSAEAACAIIAQGSATTENASTCGVGEQTSKASM
jgi:hypothetical protein